MTTFKDILWVLGVLFIIVFVTIVGIIVTDSYFGISEAREAYKAKCEASGGVVITARDMPKKCMKKEFFIDMGK